MYDSLGTRALSEHTLCGSQLVTDVVLELAYLGVFILDEPVILLLGQESLLHELELYGVGVGVEEVENEYIQQEYARNREKIYDSSSRRGLVRDEYTVEYYKAEQRHEDYEQPVPEGQLSLLGLEVFRDIYGEPEAEQL